MKCGLCGRNPFEVDDGTVYFYNNACLCRDCWLRDGDSKKMDKAMRDAVDLDKVAEEMRNDLLS